ncbi:MAG: transcriptional regulator [Gemmatimonadota bacterium]
MIALEADRYVPSLLLAVRLARVFRIPVEELFALEGN